MYIKGPYVCFDNKLSSSGSSSQRNTRSSHQALRLKDQTLKTQNIQIPHSMSVLGFNVLSFNHKAWCDDLLFLCDELPEDDTLLSKHMSGSLKYIVYVFHLLHLLVVMKIQRLCCNTWFSHSRVLPEKLIMLQRIKKAQYRSHKSPPPVPIQRQFNPVYILQPYISQLNLNIIPSYTSYSSQRSRAVTHPHHNLVCIYVPNTFHMVRPTDLLSFDCLNNIWRRIKFTKILITQFYSAAYCFLTHMSNTPFRILFSNTFRLRNQDLHPYKTTGKIVVLQVLICVLLDSKWGGDGFWTESYKNSTHLIFSRIVLENVLSSTWQAFSGMNIKIPWQCKGSHN
jgi:hypothetical protein